MAKGQLYVVSAPSGAGKTSLVKALCSSMDNIVVSVSHTTRKPRMNEKNGQNYHFVSTEIFRKMIINKELLEYAEVFGNFYGTHASWVKEQQCKGNDIILELDWQGAQQIRQHIPEAISIFILPPSQEELRSRLEARGTDDTEIIAHRMAKATSETSHYHEFDYIIINKHFEEALSELQAVICCQRLRYENQHIRHAALVKELLS